MKVPDGLWKTNDLVNQEFWFLRKDKTHVDVHSDDVKSDNNKEQVSQYILYFRYDQSLQITNHDMWRKKIYKTCTKLKSK